MAKFIEITQFNLKVHPAPKVLVNIDEIETIVPGTNELTGYTPENRVITLITKSGRTIVTTAHERSLSLAIPALEGYLIDFNKEST